MHMSDSQRDMIARLYAAYFFMLLCYAESALCREDAAEEAVQETFRIACARAAELEASGNPAGWLMNTLKNTLRNRNRILRRFRQMFSSLPLEEADRAAPDSGGELELTISALLSREEYQIYRLVIAEGETTASAARILGITPAACRKRVQRVRDKLRTCFTENGDEKGGENRG